MKSVVAVTGATGFIGQALCGELRAHGCSVCGVVRSLLPAGTVDGVRYVAVGDIGAETDWSDALSGVDCVVHCAGRARLPGAEADTLAACREVNLAGAPRLAEQAAVLGVRRLVYLSSIKVNGKETVPGVPFSALDASAPRSAYGRSKWEEEQALRGVAVRTGLEVVIVRPPLVYGPGVKGNMARLLRLVRLGLPLPLGMVNNRRSLVGLDNLVDLLIRCADHPRAAGQTFLVSDGEDLSTPELLRHMAAAMGYHAVLFPVPLPLLRLAGRAVGRLSDVERLISSLQVDISHTREVLDWTPPISVYEGLRRMVASS